MRKVARRVNSRPLVPDKKKPVRRRKKHANFALPERKRKKQAYLAALEQTGNSATACAMVGVHRNLPYWWMETDKKFAEQKGRAHYRGEQGEADLLECEAGRRAMGYEVPKWYQGEIVGKDFMVSDNLLMFRLKGIRPEKYRENINPLLLNPGEIKVQVNLFTGSSPPPQLHEDQSAGQPQPIDLNPGEGES